MHSESPLEDCITESMGRMFCTELPEGLETVLEKVCFFHCIAHLMNLSASE